MQLVLRLFLIVATDITIAQQYSPAVVSEAVPLPSSEPSTSETTTSAGSTGPAALPDAPSYTTQQPSIQNSTSPPTRTLTGMTKSHLVAERVTSASSIPKRYLNFATPDSFGNSRSSSLAARPTSRQLGDPNSRIWIAMGQNCSHGSTEKADGGGWITPFVSLTSKGGHYSALGEGGFWKRGTYVATRAVASPRFDGANSFNMSDIFAPGPGFPATVYYPYQKRSSA